jgi:hypothetical protein
MMYRSGMKEKGNFDRGYLEGIGKRIFPGGDVSQGIFERGELSSYDLSSHRGSINSVMNKSYKMEVVSEK